MTFHAMTEHYEEITVCGKPALFTSIRIKRDTVPDGLYTYDVRHDDECRGIPCEIAPYVMVNHWGTIILAEPLELPDDRRRYIDEETDWIILPWRARAPPTMSRVLPFPLLWLPTATKNCLKDAVWTVLYQNQRFSGHFKVQNTVLKMSLVIFEPENENRPG